MIMKLGEVYKVFNCKKKIKFSYNIGNFWFLNRMSFCKEKEGGGRKADKPKLVIVVSVETATKFAYVIL